MATQSSVSAPDCFARQDMGSLPAALGTIITDR